jgi:hypothetical protein
MATFASRVHGVMSPSFCYYGMVEAGGMYRRGPRSGASASLPWRRPNGSI